MKSKKAITDAQIKSAVIAKAEKMSNELKRNPNNTLTSQRLAEFKKLHASKLAGK